MIEPYLIRSRLFLALDVPAQLCPLLHAWSIVENRKFCHEFMGEMLCLRGSETAIRTAVKRKLDALAQFLTSSPVDLGSIKRGGGKDRETTFYGSFSLNRAVPWIQEQLVSDPDTSNPIVAIDRHVSGAIALHVPAKQKTSAAAPRKKKTARFRTREESESYRHLLCCKSVAWQKVDGCTLGAALKLAEIGFPVFPVWGVENGICRCRKGPECETPGKHPIPRRWQQIATTYPITINRFWIKHPFANVGIATGRKMKNGEYLSVIDVDERHFGHGTLSVLERSELCPLPLTREHSAGGGPHKFFTHPRGFHTHPGALGQGIDVQSFGKFVIGAGMNARGKPYELIADRPIARLPDQWADRIDAIREKKLPMIPEGQRRAKLLSWAGGMARDGKGLDLIVATLKDRRERRLEKGSHSFTDGDLRDIASYCIQQEKSKQRINAA